MAYEPLPRIATAQHVWLPLWPSWSLWDDAHLLLMVEWALWLCQGLILLSGTREPGAAAASRFIPCL